MTAATPFAALLARARAASRAQLAAFLARARLGAAELAALQTQRLRALLAHAAARSPFYARRLRHVDPERFELADLARLPSVSKAELMAELDSVFADRRLDRELAERALAATADEPVPILERYLAQATGGSSGRRGIFVCDVDAWAEVSSAVPRALLAHAPSGSDGRPGPLVLAMVAAASPVHSTGLAAALNPPGGGPLEIASVPATLAQDEIVARLNELRPHALVGYPSVLARLARERTGGRLRIEPRLVATTSEMLGGELRAAIRAGFAAPVVDVFGCTEGLMGATEPDGSVFAFNSDTCIAEPVDEHDRPVPIGAPSARVLVTNLANRVQPLVRYALEDRFTRRPDAAGDGRLRATVEGRADEALRWDGVEVHPLVVRAVLLKRPEVLDYLVRQTPDGVDVSVLCDAPLAEAKLRDELRAALSAAGLRDPAVTLARVDALERHRETGKLRRFIPLAR